MTLRNALCLGSIVSLLFVAACSESSPPKTSSGSGGASGGSAGGTGGSGSGGQSGAGSGGQIGSGGQSGAGSGGATGGSAGGAGGTDAGLDAGADTSGPETSVDGAAGGVVVDPTTGNGKFEFSGAMAVPADAVLKAGVTAGTVTDIMVTGRVFPGPRPVHVYKPNGYVANTPVAFMVFFDNTDYIERFKIPTILDNYIAAKKLPMMVAVFISESGNRSVEYDSLNDANTRFVMDDIFPEVEKLGIKLSTDPDASCVGGHSSGGIAAFTMGWHRPDRFHRIISNSGSFTNIRGGNAYPMMVRTTMPTKPLRVFMTAGTADMPGWENASEQMHLAFMATNYQYRYIRMIGGTHNQLSPATIMPENLLWVWKGFPISGATR